jgi:hypothetical protein
MVISLPALDCVCKDIGSDWKDLARILSVREGDIDDIEEQYPKKLKERAYEVFSDLSSVWHTLLRQMVLFLHKLDSVL